jgi:hypothetical protein
MILYALLLQVDVMLMGSFRQAALGLRKHSLHTEVLAAGQQCTAN